MKLLRPRFSLRTPTIFIALGCACLGAFVGASISGVYATAIVLGQAEIGDEASPVPQIEVNLAAGGIIGLLVVLTFALAAYVTAVSRRKVDLLG